MIGTAIALNLLIPQIPLVAGCVLSIFEVMLILIFYRPSGPMRGLRAFEYFVMLLVLTVVVCFCIQLSLIRNMSAAQVFRGYLPSSALVERTALYQACGILGATVMPHSLYLGSGIVQARLYDFDRKAGLLPPTPTESPTPSVIHVGHGSGNNNRNDNNNNNNNNNNNSNDDDDRKEYIPSLAAVRHSLKYSVAELIFSLLTFALFVNSAILIVAGASIYDDDDGDRALDADLFGIHDLLSESIAPAAGTVFALALLFSGVSAGVVCTIAGQMVSEGALRWSLRPWLRRLVTRSISIAPSVVIAAAVGRDGLNAALNGSQVALSIALPFVTAPLIYFTSLDRYMMVRPGMARYGGHYGRRGRRRRRRRSRSGCRRLSDAGETGNDAGLPERVSPPAGGRGGVWGRMMSGWLGMRRRCRDGGDAVRMANGWPVACFGVVVWLIITVMNVANLVLLGKGA